MGIGESFCGHCGRPSIWATHDERVSWEVNQWRAVNGSRVSANGGAPSAVATLPREEVVYVADYRRSREDEVVAPATPSAVAPPQVAPPTAPPPLAVAPAPVAEPIAPPAVAQAALAPVETPTPAVVAQAAPIAELAAVPVVEVPPAIEPLCAVEAHDPPSTNELLEELVLLVGRMNERVEAIELAVMRPPWWRRLVAFVRGLFREE
jgi:hypothetical protein